MSYKLPKERLRSIPRQSGVYLMKDRKGTVIYIGKAKNLKARVSSYFFGQDSRFHISYLLENVRTIDTLVTLDERQALVLEADLIRKYKPKYNIRLKDDRAYIIVRIDREQEYPRLELVRMSSSDGADYIGPFVFSNELRCALDVINRSLPLRTCSDRMLRNRVRPCIEHQIGRCCAPCCLTVDKSEYNRWLSQAVSILKGDVLEVCDKLEVEMHKASELLFFEEAVVLRDRIKILRRLQEEKKHVRYGEGAIDAFGFYREGKDIEVTVLLVRSGRLYDSKTFMFSNVELCNEEVLASVLSQFYQDSQLIPESIVLPFDLEDSQVYSSLLSERTKSTVSISAPKRGVKYRLKELAQENAKHNFEARFCSIDKNERLLKALQDEFSLPQLPRIIECVDVSHFQGSSTVASVVCFKDAKPERARYRKFKLTQEGKPDDFASINEVVRRHLSRCQEENTLSDLLIVDGGAQQLAQAIRVRKELGLESPSIISLAKKRTRKQYHVLRVSNTERYIQLKPERVFTETERTSIILDPASEVLKLLQRLRDEAHRFAISFHRELRAKKSFRSVLDDIAGVGAKRKLDLLREFKSIKCIRESADEEIARRVSIPLALAKRIKKRLSS